LSILHIDGLSFGYSSTPVLRALNATVDCPELIALIGPKPGEGLVI